MDWELKDGDLNYMENFDWTTIQSKEKNRDKLVWNGPNDLAGQDSPFTCKDPTTHRFPYLCPFNAFNFCCPGTMFNLPKFVSAIVLPLQVMYFCSKGNLDSYSIAKKKKNGI